MNRQTVAASVLLFLSPSASLAAADASTRIIDGFAACRPIAPDRARADCFDAAARALESAVRTKDVTIVDRQEVRTARRSLFGFTIPRIGLFDGGERDTRGDGARADDRDEFREIETSILLARPLPNGRMELHVAEGDAVWATTDPMPFPPKRGAKVRIRKGAMSNYFISVDGERSVRGTRIR